MTDEELIEQVARASEKVERLSRELDITNADHIALWLEGNTIQDEPMSQCVSWLACRIVEAHERAIAAMQADAAPVAWLYSHPDDPFPPSVRADRHDKYDFAAMAKRGWTETPLYAHPPVDNRVSTSSPVVAHETPETSGKLRDAVEVFWKAADAATLVNVRYKPEAERAAAAVIKADREAVRAEQAAELAKFKALAETLAGAVKALMPTHINLRMPHPDDSFIVPLDVNMGELRALDAALRKWEEARDAS